MMGRRRTCRLSDQLAALVLLFALCAAAVAQAEPQVYLWGFQRGCERMAGIDRLVEKEMFAQGKRVALLSAVAGRELPACPGERCGQALQLACPGATGWLLGGQAVQGRSVTKTRLWLYDLATGQLAYQDDYCQTCSLIAALPVQARQLIEHPRFGAVPSAKPGYCAQLAAPARPAGPIFLTVYGEGKHKPALQLALKDQLESQGRTVLPATTESNSYSRDVLLSLVKSQQDARVLMVDTQKDGKVAVYLFDQKTALIEGKTVHCSTCEKENVVSQVKEVAADLLVRCFGVQCATSTTGAPPAEACEPFPEEPCDGLDTLAVTSSPIGKTGGPLDPFSAKLLKGLSWGAFAASAATAAGLFVGGAAESGASTDANPLYRAAGTATGLSLLMLGVAIPTTIVVDHATRAKSKPLAGVMPTPNFIQCPSP